MHIKKSMVYSQVIGYKGICSDKFTFEHQASNIFQNFLNKDYPFKLIYIEFRKVSHIDRNNLLEYSHKNDTNSNPSIPDFHSANLKFYLDIKNVWSNFAENPPTGKLFSTPSIIAQRLPPNHRLIPIHSKVNETTTSLPGNSKCDAKICQICNLIDTRHSFVLPGIYQLWNQDHFHATH